MSKKLIQSDGTEFEQNGKDMAIIDTRSRGGIPIMINADEFNEAYANADSKTKSMIHAGSVEEEVDPVFTASPAYGIQDADINNWNGKLSSESDPVFSASPAANITDQNITEWNNKSDFSGDYNDLTNKPAIPTNTSDLNNDSGFLTSESDPVFGASPAAGITAQDILNWNDKIDINEVYKALAEEYDSTKTYSKGQYTYYNGNVYRSNTYINPAEAWNVNHWDLVNPVDAMNILNYISKGQQSGDIQFSTCEASGGNSFSAGNGSTASGNAAVAFGSSSVASGASSLAVGMGTKASAAGGTALNNSSSKGMYSTSLNMGNVLSSGMGCVAEGTGTVGTDTQGASPTQFCHAEGSSTVYGYYSHAEGNNNTSYGNGMHVEGYNNTIGSSSDTNGTGGHAEGYNNAINGTPAAAHVEGQGCVVGPYGNMAHAEGYHTIANSVAQHAEGQFNIEASMGLPVLHIVGNGSGDNARSNAHTLDMNGDAWYAGDVYVGSTSGTNKDSGSVKLLRSDVIAPEYDSTSTYTLCSYVMHDGKLYECTTAITQAEDWTAGHWTQRTLADLLGTIRSLLSNV